MIRCGFPWRNMHWWEQAAIRGFQRKLEVGADQGVLKTKRVCERAKGR